MEFLFTKRKAPPEWHCRPEASGARIGRGLPFLCDVIFVTKPPKETPENHLTSGHRVAPEGEGSARGRPPHKNSHPPRPRFYVERMSVCTESITRGARRDDVTTKWSRLTSATGRDGRVTSYDVTPDARPEADGPVPQPRPTHTPVSLTQIRSNTIVTRTKPTGREVASNEE